MGLFGNKKDTRPVDEGLARIGGVDEKAAIDFWSKRLDLICAVPSDVARVGALTPQIRELTRIEDMEARRRITRARLIAFAQLPQNKRDILAAARRQAFSVDPAVMNEDQKLVEELLPGLDANVRSAYPSAPAGVA
jgi:hypothetical protein